MPFIKKFYLFRKIKISRHIFHWKKFSTEVKSEVNDSGVTPSLIKKIIHNFLIPSLEQDSLKKVEEITGLTMKMGHLSWAKISVPTLTILEWNFQSIPEDFKNMDESFLLKLAYNLKQNIPVSDLYVMEKIGPKEVSKNLNNILLSTMLMVLLNHFDNSVQKCEKVVLQKENVMNILYSLLIGSERTSARQIFETLLHEVNKSEKINVSKDNSAIFYTITKFNLESLKFYDKSSLLQQESLSFVLLLTLSFIEIFIYQNVESLRKIQKTKFKRT